MGFSRERVLPGDARFSRGEDQKGARDYRSNAPEAVTLPDEKTGF